jgi:hypothetical protein
VAASFDKPTLTKALKDHLELQSLSSVHQPVADNGTQVQTLACNVRQRYKTATVAFRTLPVLLVGKRPFLRTIGIAESNEANSSSVKMFRIEGSIGSEAVGGAGNL